MLQCVLGTRSLFLLLATMPTSSLTAKASPARTCPSSCARATWSSPRCLHLFHPSRLLLSRRSWTSTPPLSSPPPPQTKGRIGSARRMNSTVGAMKGEKSGTKGGAAGTGTRTGTGSIPAARTGTARKARSIIVTTRTRTILPKSRRLRLRLLRRLPPHLLLRPAYQSPTSNPTPPVLPPPPLETAPCRPSTLMPVSVPCPPPTHWTETPPKTTFPSPLCPSLLPLLPMGSPQPQPQPQWRMMKGTRGTNSFPPPTQAQATQPFPAWVQRQSAVAMAVAVAVQCKAHLFPSLS
mmetsp:Transcript_33167/g.53779  ORF Transcript_33167/g.53779 Transcript_33167/m.53779 type:complete len:293 (+) Transcript_33167:2653-3531(+)